MNLRKDHYRNSTFQRFFGVGKSSESSVGLWGGDAELGGRVFAARSGTVFVTALPGSRLARESTWETRVPLGMQEGRPLVTILEQLKMQGTVSQSTSSLCFGGSIVMAHDKAIVTRQCVCRL